ncbi:hypothetical protein [Sphingomonas jeddahensis]|uniref:Glycosyl transferases group 1 n=1 Tax=Sphingomonas jeddahensis TaxID=1915074 RepID=A0A1V2EVE4_9SPHN|nr:hypothetical protein [Sphingomonas jeddahensis]ONF96457.1 hypothetical protein SPHI_12420 [Sphingomonas jeddahensis]
MSAPARFGWHADSYDHSLASVRYRLLMPLAALQAQGVPIERFDPAREPASYDAVIFSKSHSAGALAAARALRAAGRAVVFDLCDNLYAAHAVRHVSDARLARFQAMLESATHLTFSTAMLAEQIATDGNKPRRVIPDALDMPGASASATSRAGARQLARVDRFLGKYPDALHTIWFGKSLGSVSGFAHLHAAAARLAAQPFPITLTVVSNARLRWWLGRWRWRLPVHYVGWRQETAAAVLTRHRVAVIPVAANDYTVGKTINRPATAILSGLGVVADAIPSYEELRPFVALDDWDGGLARYRHDWDTEQVRLAAGRAFLAERYSAEAVARQWSDLLDTVALSRA